MRRAIRFCALPPCRRLEAGHPIVEVVLAEEDAAARGVLIERNLPARLQLAEPLWADIEILSGSLD